MATYGLTTAGVNAKRQETIEAELRAAVANAAALGANINTAAESPVGQILVILAAALAAMWSFAEQVLLGARVLTASGVQLDRLGQNYGVARDAAIATTVTLTLAGTPTTLVPAGSTVSLDGSGADLTLDADATIGGGGTVDATFTASATGPITALAGSGWTIETPVSGWTGATNAADATVGRDAETDGAYRSRLLQSAGRGSNNSAAVIAAVLAVSGVTEAITIENVSAATDADGRPPHSYEVVVRGGNDAAVAQAIWATKPNGIQTTTTVSVVNQVSEVVVDTNGQNRAIAFSRADQVPVWVEVDYRPQPGVFPSNGQTLMLNAVLDFGASLNIGDDVYPASLEQAITCALPARALQLFDLRVGFAASPLSAIQIPASLTEIPSFDSSRVLFTVV